MKRALEAAAIKKAEAEAKKIAAQEAAAARKLAAEQARLAAQELAAAKKAEAEARKAAAAEAKRIAQEEKAARKAAAEARKAEAAARKAALAPPEPVGLAFPRRDCRRGQRGIANPCRCLPEKKPGMPGFFFFVLRSW